MSISCLCPHCGARLSGPTSKAGRKARCPKCGQPMRLPTPPGSAVTASPSLGGAVPTVLPVANPDSTSRPKGKTRFLAFVLYGLGLFFAVGMGFAGGWVVKSYWQPGPTVLTTTSTASTVDFRPDPRGPPELQKAKQSVLSHKWWVGRVDPGKVDAVLDLVTSHGNGWVFVNQDGRAVWIGESLTIVEPFSAGNVPEAAALGHNRLVLSIHPKGKPRYSVLEAAYLLQDVLNQMQSHLQQDSRLKEEDLQLKPGKSQ